MIFDFVSEFAGSKVYTSSPFFVRFRFSSFIISCSYIMLHHSEDRPNRVKRVFIFEKGMRSGMRFEQNLRSKVGGLNGKMELREKVSRRFI